MASNYTSSGPYAFKVSEPPRVAVPPPAVEYVSNRPSFKISGVSVYEHTDEFGDPSFIHCLTSQGCNLNHRMLEWKYEERRNAQAILPFLFLGPSTAAQDKCFLRDTGITFVIAVRSDDSRRSKLVTKLDAGEELGLETAVVVGSTPLQIISQLPGAVKLINDHLRRSMSDAKLAGVSINVNLPPDFIRGKVLVFCENGNERSSAIVLAYLMAMYNLSAIEAIQAVQSQRFCITAEEPMKQMLLQFQDLLRAKRDVNVCRSSALSRDLPPLSRSKKRGYVEEDDPYEGHEWSTMGSSDSSEASRAEWAPFRDQSE